jgi:hypothetical protein
MIKFCDLHFTEFNEGTVIGPADIISVYNFSPHVVMQVEDNCSHCISYPPSKFRQSDTNGGTHTASLMNLKKTKGSKVRRTRWPSDRPAPTDPFLWKLAI